MCAAVPNKDSSNDSYIRLLLLAPNTVPTEARTLGSEMLTLAAIILGRMASNPCQRRNQELIQKDSRQMSR